jgi:alpha-beta hydrolase superfamily lysophospholipase/SAM-dependent methyltransferase
MTRPCQECHFTTHDGLALFYRHFPAASPRPRGAILLFHRGHEHGARIAHLADELDMPDFAIYAWDARGHGRSPGERGYAPSFGALERDVQCFTDHITATDGIAIEDMAIVAQSVGAVLIAAWAHDFAPRLRALVLASPAFRVKLYVPFARPLLRLRQQLRGRFFVNSYVKARFLTHDPARRARFSTDPLVTRPIASNILLDLYDAAARIVADAGAITIPTQLLISGADVVVEQKPQHDFFVNLGSAIKERHVFPGFFHDTLGELGRGVAIAHARRFLLAQFDAPPRHADLANAHLLGYTRNEAEALATPLPLLSRRGLYWAGYRAILALGATRSAGIRLGRKTGFDSGSTLDYVYRNQPDSLVDRQYLQAIGWKGIRQRKIHAEELIRAALARLEQAGLPRRVLDIAAGHGRYVLEALAEGASRPDSILLRDDADINVAAGQALIAEKGLRDIARFVQGDAFDEESIAAVEPGPTLGIVSGLYELFPDNDPVRASLRGLARAIPPGGYLVYTNQPWHPQLEMIARALTSHRQGQAWIMRRRTQAEIDQLVAAAGFRKLEQRIDEWGIFTVSLAVRVDPR